MKKSLIIDGNSIINRAFYGIKNMATNTGFPTGAIYGFVNILNSVKEELKPDYLVVCFDLKGPTFRHEAYGEYKGTRKGMPEELAMQLPEVKEILKAMNIEIATLQGFEADDLLGAISKRFEEDDVISYLLTGDKDSLQLVSDRTFVYYHGTKNKIIYDKAAVFEDLGVYPHQVVDLKAIMGDTSDNIPGISGIGKVGAAKLIEQFQSLDAILEHSDEIKSKRTRELVENGMESALLSKRLATIVRDLPIEIEIEDYQVKAPNYEELIELYKKFGLNKFLSQIIKARTDKRLAENKEEKSVQIQEENEPVFYDMARAMGLDEAVQDEGYSKCDELEETVKFSDEEEILQFIGDLSEGERLFLIHLIDVEDVVNAEFSYLGMMKEDEGKIFVHFRDEKFLKQVFSMLMKKKIRLIGHGLKNFHLVLKNYDLDLDSEFDTQIAMYLCEANKNSFELHDLALYMGFTTHVKEESELLGKGKSQIKYFELEENEALRYIYATLYVVAKAYHVLKDKLETLGMSALYKDVELPLVKVLAELQYNGMAVDTLVLDELDIRLCNLIEGLESEIYNLAGEEFNISSPKQLGVILYEKLKLPAPKKTKTGYSTSHDVLVKLYDRHEIIPRIIEYRRYTKLKSTYIEGLRAVINPYTHRIHSSFNQTVAATGRLSSTEPNLQNIPIRLEIGREFRKAFVAKEGYVLVDADYSQIELRILAHLSKDEKLIEAYQKGIDIHTMTASQVFDIPIEEVSADIRSHAKAVNFGIVYGMSDFGLSENLQIPIKEAGEYIKNYFAKYPKVKRFMDEVVMECQRLGYSETILQRKRYIPEIHSKNFNIRGYGRRMAMNTPIQGSAADIIKIAMVRVYEQLKRRKLKSGLILQVHDELIIEAAMDELEEVKSLLKEAMEHAYPLSVNLEVDMNVGHSWFEAK